MHAVEQFLRELVRSRALGVAETSNYRALAELLNEAGKTLRPV